jgi:hypothetical protein
MAATASKDSIFVNEGLFFRSTEEIIRREKLLDVSLTSVFSVNIKMPDSVTNILRSAISGFNPDYTRINFLAYEAVLPGRSFQTGEVTNAIQGVTEKYPIAASYPEVDISFYVTRDYDTLTFFSAWMEAMAPVVDRASSVGYMKFSYPDNYECNVNVVKYERDLRYKNQRLTAKPGSSFVGGIQNPPSYTHSLINAYPINIISIPLSYNQSDILRTTITFNYDRYVVQKNNTIIDNESPFQQTSRDPNIPFQQEQEQLDATINRSTLAAAAENNPGLTYDQRAANLEGQDIIDAQNSLNRPVGRLF